MAGRHEVGPDLLAVGPELAELEPDVAHHARVGRSARQVLVGEVILDPAEVALEIERVERDVEPVGDLLGVGGIGDAAAGFGPPLRVHGIGTGAHEEADDLVALRLQQAAATELSTPPLIARTTRLPWDLDHERLTRQSRNLPEHPMAEDQPAASRSGFPAGRERLLADVRSLFRNGPLLSRAKDLARFSLGDSG